jgi:hypothetical protein
MRVGIEDSIVYYRICRWLCLCKLISVNSRNCERTRPIPPANIDWVSIRDRGDDVRSVVGIWGGDIRSVIVVEGGFDLDFRIIHD